MTASRGPARALAVLVLSLLATATVSGTAAGSLPDELARCAAIDKTDKRLNCYDLLAGRAPADDKRAFGLAAQVPRADSAAPQSVQARVARVSVDRLGHSVVLLDNQQAWIVADGDVIADPGDLVTIKRAALGSFLMLTPSRRTYRVQRKQ